MKEQSIHKHIFNILHSEVCGECGGKGNIKTSVPNIGEYITGCPKCSGTGRVLKEGACYHSEERETFVRNNKVKCRKCNKLVPFVSASDFRPLNPTYDNPEGFFKIWNYSVKQDWWEDFCYKILLKYFGEEKIGLLRLEGCILFNKFLVNPKTFYKLFAEYHGWKEEK